MKKLFIIFAVLCLAAPAMAADWNLYGSARFGTWRQDTDMDDGTDSDAETIWEQQSNSRIGANVMANDAIGGRFEYGVSGGQANIRHMYGTYDSGSLKVLIGQTENITSFLYPNTVYGADNDLNGLGHFYTSRAPQIRLTMADASLSLVSPKTTDAYAGDIDYNIPKIELAYKLKMDAFFVDIAGGYQTYTLDRADDIDIDSYVVVLGGGATFGQFGVKASVHMGQNLGNYGIAFANPDINLIDNMAEINGTDTNDADGLGYMALVTFGLNDMVTFELGYGHEDSEVDNSNNKQELDQIYVNATITIAPGFFVVPEFGMVKASQDASSAEPEIVYGGAKWQINF